MGNALNKLLRMLDSEPAVERSILLQATCAGDLPRILALLPQAVSASGGWLLRLTPATPENCSAMCELERSSLLDFCVELANLGLTLSDESAHVLTQAWRAGRSAPDAFDAVTVEMQVCCLPGAGLRAAA